MPLVNFTARTGSDLEPLPMSWPFRSQKDQWKRSSSSRAAHILQTVLYQYTLLLRYASQGYIIDPNTDTSWKLDLIMTRREHLKDACTSRVYHSVDCNTDHSLVWTKVKVQQKNWYCAKQTQINTVALSENAERLQVRLSSETTNADFQTSAESHWVRIRDITHKAALPVFGRKKTNS